MLQEFDCAREILLQLIVIETKNDVFNQLAWSHPEQNNLIILIFPRCYILLSYVTAITLLLVFYCCILLFEKGLCNDTLKRFIFNLHADLAGSRLITRYN